MADLGYYDDKLQKDDQQNQNAQGSGQIPDASGASSGAISGTGSQPNTAGVGAGGQGAWTNIQAYLNANKKDTGAGQSLESKVGGVLGQEKQNLNQSVNDTVQKANDEAKVYTDAKDKTGEWVNKAANAYSWDGNQNDEYRNQVNNIKNLQTRQYQGPSSYAYANSADYSRANDALKDDNAFKGYLGDLYKERTGGQLNAGQAALQNQFDVNNENLASTRQRLLDQMAGFDTEKENAIKTADQGIQAARNQYGNNQASYNDSLYGMMNDLDSNIAQQEIDARKAYQNEYTGGKSGLANAVMGNLYNDPEDGFLHRYNAWGDNLTWQQLQNEQEAAKDPSASTTYGNLGLGGRYEQATNNFRQNTDALNNFYKQQDEKYGMTADPEERKYNTLAEILGNSNKKEKGFKVRG